MYIGKTREWIVVLVLAVVTLGIYSIFWIYTTFEDAKRVRGEGVGGVVGLLLCLIPIVPLFLLPSEVGQAQQKAGIQQSVAGVSGFWCLIPFVGGLIWLIKVQNGMNMIWAARSSGNAQIAPPPVPQN
jgi:hypothetical protein